MKGAMPVPGPTITAGAAGSAGGRKCGARWTRTGTGVPGSASARNGEHTPWRRRPAGLA